MIEQIRQKASGLFGGEADRGVSPVIGVILMVAITVILAAVIGAFVMGLGDDLGNEANAGVSVTQDSNGVNVDWTSKGNADVIRFGGDYEGDKTLENVGGTVTFTVGDSGDLSSDGTLTVIAVTNPGGDETTTVVQSYDVQ